MTDRTTGEGRLSARPGAPEAEPERGLHRLGQRGLLYVPDGYDGGAPAPLAVMLHGAGGNARQGISLLAPLADALGVVVVAPTSRGDTWDVLRGGYGPDVERIDALLEEAFARCRVDPARVAVGGFSDGASYALSLGITNGDLFTHVLAFSPGFAAPASRSGRPGIFVSHGDDDAVLPVDVCSRRIVPRLAQAGYEVVYREFAGGHAVPPDVAREAVGWFLGRAGDR